MTYNYRELFIPVSIIKKNNKNTYIRIKNNEIYITTNYFTREKTIEKLLKDNKNSIDKMLDKSFKKEKKDKKFQLFNNYYEVTYNTNIKNIIIENGKIYTRNEKELLRWLNNYTYNIYKEHLDIWYQKFEETIPYPILKIRRMTTRWGVCNTRKKQITLNTELIKYNINCLDYVIVHELSHFLEGNHSKKFWNIVEKYYPDYKQARKELRE